MSYADPALVSSENMCWQTPSVVLGAIRSTMGAITLDPCTVESNPTGAEEYLTPAHTPDGLHASWTVLATEGLIYVNPPYGRGLGKWATKCVVEARAGAEIILLVPARPDTKWFGEVLLECTSVAFWRGRLRFNDAPAPAPFPSALFYWGRRRWDFCKAFAPHAHVLADSSWSGGPRKWEGGSK